MYTNPTPTPPPKNLKHSTPLYDQPPPTSASLFQRILWRLRRTHVGSLNTTAHTVHTHIHKTDTHLTVDLIQPFHIHTDTQQLSENYTALSITLTQTLQDHTTRLTLRAAIPSQHLHNNLPKQDRNTPFLNPKELLPLLSHISFYAELHNTPNPLPKLFQTTNNDENNDTEISWDISKTSPTPQPTPQPTHPTTPNTAVVGVGLGPIRVGHSKVRDVLHTFGSDCMLHTYGRPNLPGTHYTPSARIYNVSYIYDHKNTYDPSRAANATRPSSLQCDPNTHIITSITISGPQQDITLLNNSNIPLHNGGYSQPLPPLQEHLPTPHITEYEPNQSDLATYHYPLVGLRVVATPHPINTVNNYTITHPIPPTPSLTAPTPPLLIPKQGLSIPNPTLPSLPTPAITLGTSTLHDALSFFGTDCTLRTSPPKNISPTEYLNQPDSYRNTPIHEVNYHYTEDNSYQPERYANRIRPSSIKVDPKTHTITSLEFSAYQRLPTLHPHNITTQSSLQDVQNAFGPPTTIQHGDPLQKHLYPHLGLSFTINKDTQSVNSFHMSTPSQTS